jgi:hypothetical protein
MKRRPDPVICRIGYVEEAMEADRRMRAGEHQHQCRHCSKWYWPLHKYEHGQNHDPAPSGEEVGENGVHKVRVRKHPCPDCQEAQEQYAMLVANGWTHRVLVKRMSEPKGVQP